MKKGVALCLIVPLVAIVSSVEVKAGATISDRRYWPNEARGSPDQAIEISPPYMYIRRHFSHASDRGGRPAKIDKKRSGRKPRRDALQRAGLIGENCLVEKQRRLSLIFSSPFDLHQETRARATTMISCH